jgi:hypothetical protein
LSKNLLLISSVPDDKIFATEVAKVAGLELLVQPRLSDAIKTIGEGRANVVFADVSTPEQYQELETALQNSVGLFSDKLSTNSFHFLCSDDLGKHLVQSPIFGHFVHRCFSDAAEAGRHYGRIVRMEGHERAFGLNTFFGDGVKIQKIEFKDTTQKQQAAEAVKNYLLTAKFKSRMASVIANAVDELLMNAMFDAPVDDLGKPLFSATSRATKMKLEGKHAVEMQVAFDGSYVAVSVSDLFGSLDKNRLLTHISKRYTDEEYQVKSSYAGAGIGLATVFRTGGSLMFMSETRVQTEVIVFFKRTESFKDFKDQFRFIATQFYF